MKTRYLVILIFLGIFTACLSQGQVNGNYSYKIEDNKYRVTANGNEYIIEPDIICNSKKYDVINVAHKLLIDNAKIDFKENANSVNFTLNNQDYKNFFVNPDEINASSYKDKMNEIQKSINDNFKKINSNNIHMLYSFDKNIDFIHDAYYGFKPFGDDFANFI
jgi:hypothetical protein